MKALIDTCVIVDILQKTGAFLSGSHGNPSFRLQP